MVKQYLPNGVMKVVSNALSLSSGICPNPELASRVENTWAPASCARDCSTAERGCLSHLTLLLSWVRSTKMRTFPLPFDTTTIPAHQSVGSLMLVISPSLSILASSSFTGCIRRTTTLRGTVNVKVWFLLPVGLCSHHPVFPGL